ncbi:sensor histidine kinase [Dactylosporangium salmoneum]|uniref:histidine kinase n=1 Tax=Dactylosporangium salmoneum TaxID=53361 RepID=A0ABP5SN09_9ACTN
MGTDIIELGRDWVTRHRARLSDLLLAGAAGALALQSEWQAGPGRTAAVLAVSVAAILVRRRWPVPALLAVTAAALLTVVLETPSGALLLVLGALMYSTALHTSHRRPWLYALSVSGILFLAGLLVDFDHWWAASSIGLFAWICGGGALGDAVRNRRAYIAEVTERALQAERTREDEARRRVMDERLRIARELHDVVAHHIAVINVQAGAAGHVIARHPEQAGPVLEVIREASDTVLREIKSVISVLREPGETDSTEPSPGLDRVPDLIRNFAATGFRIELRSDGEPRPLPAIADLAAYRIVQESLTNAHRYGRGAAEVTIAWTARAVTIEVLNDIGAARPGRPTGSGFGLLGMRERAAAAHGTVVAGPAPGGRFRVHVTLPATEPAGPPQHDAAADITAEGDQRS